MKKRYTLRYRPPGFATLPRIGWTLIERPREGFEKRQDLPVSQYRHGVIEFERDLTPAEMETYEIIDVFCPDKTALD